MVETLKCIYLSAFLVTCQVAEVWHKSASSKFRLPLYDRRLVLVFRIQDHPAEARQRLIYTKDDTVDRTEIASSALSELSTVRT